ncbi:DUF6157 family protein [Asticcacaulis sp. AC402]|uniref:DUF6157 family protein n=1 Tax=Asticcacaulis sp. AC402 TaxID=1282361 RepID=UPI0003C3EB7A|nr:DUF6157 family protein [Asticcacaulis sp. AC402]ESQ75295.1 hypothetical protein ABAC402_09325 [Asticcacaulis sp. AC402]
MKITNTFIAVADDTQATQGIVPPEKNGEPSLAWLHYSLLGEHPYEYDLDSFNFEVYCRRNRIAPEHREGHRAAFFSKGHPCMRASPLTKSYGFGAHYNTSGKIAIYPMDSVAYRKFLNDPDITIEMALRAKRPEKSAQGARLDPGSRPKGLHTVA